MAKDKKNLRKEIRRRFERSFDLARLDYARRIKPIKPKAMLYGVISAGILYGIGFALAWLGWSRGMVPTEGFAKLVWVMMLPTTVLGLLVWQLAKNRMEYPIRQDILGYMNELESKEGLIWRFAPLTEQFELKDYETKKVYTWSQQGQLDKMAVEDYTGAIDGLKRIFQERDGREFHAQTVAAVAKNLNLAE